MEATFSTRRRDKAEWSKSTTARLLYLISRLAAHGIRIIIMQGNTKMSRGMMGFLRICLNSFSIKYFSTISFPLLRPYYSSLSLNFFKLSPMSKAAIPDSINASCHTAAMPKPSIITFFTA